MDNTGKSLFSAVLKRDLSTIKVSLQEKNAEEVTQLAVQHISISSLSLSIRSLDIFEKMTSCSISSTTPFLTSAALGLVDIFEIFILRGVPINTATDEGIMVSHMASLFGQKKIMKMIMDKYGGNISIPDQYGWSCLHFACVDGRQEIAQMLLDAGIDPMERDKDGTTAAYRAKEGGYLEIVDLIRIYTDSDRLLSIKDATEDGYGYINADAEEEDGYLVPDELRLPSHSIPRPQLKRHGNESPDYAPSLPFDEEAEGEEFGDDNTPQITSLREVTRPKQKPVKSLPPPVVRKESHNLMDTIRQELQKFHESNKKKVIDKPTPPIPTLQPPDESDEEEDHYCSIVDFEENIDEEDPYSTIAEVIAAAHKQTVPDPPTVRGRLPASKIRLGLPEKIRKDVNSISIIQDMPGSAALKRACLFVSIRINSNWPKLSKALELTNDDIKTIKSSYHYDGTQQCAVALKRWQTIKNREVDDLVIVLKKSGMESIVIDVQQVVSEFSA